MKRLLYLISILAITVSCTGADLPKSNFDDQIKEKYWKMTLLDDQPVIMESNQEREIYFILKNDGIVKGFSGCHYFTANYRINGNTVHFSKLKLDDKKCESTHKEELLQFFQGDNRFQVQKDELLLKGRTADATFEAIYFN